MLTGNALLLYKKKILSILADYSGIEVREDQVITDAQINLSPNVRPDDARQALDALKGDGFAARRVDDLRGAVWKITPEGHAAKSKLALTEEDA